jgi:yopX protein
MQDLKIKIYHPLARRIIESEEIVDLHFSLGKVQSASILLDDNESPELYEEYKPNILLSTNKKDINNIEIFEKHIVQGYHNKQGKNVQGWVEYFDQDAAFVVRLNDGDYCYLFNLDNIKIIGSALNLGRKES